MNLKISIITVVYNDKYGLIETIDSISDQKFKDFQFIVIDGGSTDGTVDVILSNTNLIDSWVSEPDNGIYYAMNKGLGRATGGFVIFLNAGDKFYDSNTLADVVENISDENAVYFGRALNRTSSNTTWLFPPTNVSSLNIEGWLERNVPNHQTMFFPKSFYSTNLFDCTLKISADADYKWRAKMYFKLKFIFVDLIVSVFQIGGVSTDYSNYKTLIQRSKDSWIVQNRYFGFITAIKFQIFLFSKFLAFKIVNQRILNNFFKAFYK